MKPKATLTTYEIDSLTEQMGELDRAIEAGFQLLAPLFNRIHHERAVLINALADSQGYDRKGFLRMRQKIEKGAGE